MTGWWKMSGEEVSVPTVSNESRGVEWELELERADLLPGQIAKGRLRLHARDDLHARGLIVALIGTEQWQHEVTETDSEGRTRTRTETTTRELQRLPVQVLGPTNLAPGDRREVDIEVPVPPLGPATLDATVSRLTWEIEAKLDVPGGLDSALVVAVNVLQPTALLRAGVVHVGEFALYAAADSETDGARATLDLDPVPLCVGAPFTGRLSIATDRALKLQEIRVEVRVKVHATVPSGLKEEITLWVGQIQGESELPAGSRTFEIRGELPPQHLATVELPHGESDATVHVILARPWARDPHLVRDVAICSTTEI